MAATPVRVMYGFAGITGATLKLFALGSSGTGDPANGSSGDTLTALTNRPIVYEAVVTEALSGRYEAYMYSSGGVVLHTGVVDLADTTDVCTVGELAVADVSVALSAEDVQDIIDGVVSGVSGTGARTVTITVNDGTDPLEGASVRVTKGVETYVQTTNVNGQVTFNLDDGTWTVGIVLAGYSYSGTTLAVDGNETVTCSMSEIGISPPSGPNKLTGYVVCLDENGDEVVVAGTVKITCWMQDGPGATGYSRSTKKFTFTNNAAGLAQYTSFQAGATYAAKKGSSQEIVQFTTPTAGNNFALPEILGEP